MRKNRKIFCFTLLLAGMLTPYGDMEVELPPKNLSHIPCANLDTYQYIWDEFENAPEDIPGDDILFSDKNYGTFHNPSEIANKLHEVHQTFPHLVENFSIGQSFLGEEIYGIKITDEIITTNKTKVLIFGQIHAREQITAENCLYFIDKLIYEYNLNNSIIRKLLAEKEITIIPSLNVDGSSILHQNPWQRKNVKGLNVANLTEVFSPSPDTSPFEIQDTNDDGYISAYYDESSPNLYRIMGYEGIDLNKNGQIGEGGMGGIDLNRNFDFNFGNSIGSSNDPSSAMYRGLTAFSEIETANLRDYIVENEFEICLSLHSGIDSIFMPMGALTHYKDPSDENLMNQFALNLSQFLEYEPLNMSQYVSGLFEPWAYKSIQSVKIALCLEVYGNDSALIENLNETTQVNEIKGIWDKFNPAPNRVIKHSNLIFESITKTLMDYHCRKPTETQVIAGYSIGFLILNILGIAYLIKQNMNKPKMG